MKKLLAFLLLSSVAAIQAAAESPSFRVWTSEPQPSTIEVQVDAGAGAQAPIEAADTPIEAAIEAAAPAVPPEKLVGASLVIDPAHIAETIRNIAQGYERYLQLVEMVKKAQRNLDTLRHIPFVDSENVTGAFLANMHWLLAGGNYDELHPQLIEETLGYSHPEIVELLGEYFPGSRIVPGASEEPELRPDPWETFENSAELYFARDNAMLTTAYRVAELIENHAAQVARERRGISWQREQMDADGNSQHLEMLFAALHQSLDAQSVERQVNLVSANLQYLAFADQVNARLEERTRVWHRLSSLHDTLEIESLTAAGGRSVGLDP